MAQFYLGIRYDAGERCPRRMMPRRCAGTGWPPSRVTPGRSSSLGYMYINGRGVLKDTRLAHMWYNIAGANGSEIAREQRDTIEDDMTNAQIARATELARACMDSDYENCEG